jgi:hypothetical protein
VDTTADRHSPPGARLTAIIAAAGGTITVLLAATAVLALDQPDTGHGEDVGSALALAIILPMLGLTACLALGAGAAGLILCRGRARKVAAVAMVCGLIPVGLGLLSLLP